MTRDRTRQHRCNTGADETIDEGRRATSYKLSSGGSKPSSRHYPKSTPANKAEVAYASGEELGVSLMQGDKEMNGIHLIAYASRKLSGLEKKYFATERERIGLRNSSNKEKQVGDSKSDFEADEVIQSDHETDVLHEWWPEYNCDGCTNSAAIYRFACTYEELHTLHSRGCGQSIASKFNNLLSIAVEALALELSSTLSSYFSPTLNFLFSCFLPVRILDPSLNLIQTQMERDPTFARLSTEARCFACLHLAQLL
ncbi:hypothetical protein EVAR_93419_1 [Eumeta japonica]|uniref:Reverse transcriptase RNase H-like domain-containing protein n=1 Tax=Eumeta variegata TaxID=151549 RepID=A0A4C1UR68_EUMVA|nr:hypothetical protein EVAR_93419_1 [Eumeta japonica]